MALDKATAKEKQLLRQRIKARQKYELWDKKFENRHFKERRKELLDPSNTSEILSKVRKQVETYKSICGSPITRSTANNFDFYVNREDNRTTLEKIQDPEYRAKMEANPIFQQAVANFENGLKEFSKTASPEYSTWCTHKSSDGSLASKPDPEIPGNVKCDRCGKSFKLRRYTTEEVQNIVASISNVLNTQKTMYLNDCELKEIRATIRYYLKPTNKVRRRIEALLAETPY